MSVHGKNCYFGLDDSSGTLRDLSENLNSVDFNTGQDVHEDTTFGETGKTKKGGLTDGSINLAGFWDTTALTGTETVLAGLVGKFDPVDFEYGAEGDTTGKVKKSGQCVLESYNQSTPVGGLIAFTATLQISGAVTKGTFA